MGSIRHSTSTAGGQLSQPASFLVAACSARVSRSAPFLLLSSTNVRLLRSSPHRFGACKVEHKSHEPLKTLMESWLANGLEMAFLSLKVRRMPLARLQFAFASRSDLRRRRGISLSPHSTSPLPPPTIAHTQSLALMCPWM